MGTYIEQSDIENLHGTANVAKWSNLDATTAQSTADTARVALAISWAEEEVENRFRGSRYAIPFATKGSAIPKAIVQWCSSLAGLWLYQARGIRDADADRISLIAEQAEKNMDVYLAGARTLAVADENTTATGPTMIGDD